MSLLFQKFLRGIKLFAIEIWSQFYGGLKAQ